MCFSVSEEASMLVFYLEILKERRSILGLVVFGALADMILDNVFQITAMNVFVIFIKKFFRSSKRW